MITDAEKGWFAGILDFQAHITRKNNKMRAIGSQQVVLYVESRSHEIITRMCKMTGQQVEFKEQRPLREEWVSKGCTEHCPEAHVHNLPSVMPSTARWTVTGASCAVILWNLREYMVTEDEPWDWAIAQCLAGTVLSGQGSGATLKAIRRLHSAGWLLPPLMRGVPEAACSTA